LPLVRTACPGVGRALPSTAGGGFAGAGEVQAQRPESGEGFPCPRRFPCVRSVSEHTEPKTPWRS